MRLGSTLVCLIVGCGQSAGEEASSGASQPAADRGLAIGYSVPNTSIELAGAATEFALKALAVATRMSGDPYVRTYGTLTEGSGGSVSYEAMPSDRLVVVRPRSHVEIEMLGVEGSGGDARAFLDGNHRVRLRFNARDEAMAEVWSVRSGARRELGLAGTVFVDGAWWDADLRAAGVETFDVDQSGGRFFDEHDLTGAVKSDRSSVDVREHWRFELVTARGDTGMESASSAVRSIANVVMAGGERYEWVDAHTQKSFRDGRPTEIDTFWQGSGRIEKGGRAIATIEKFADVIGDAGGFVGFQLVTGGGAFELERHRAY